MWGHVLHGNGAPYGDVAVGVWSAEWDGAVTVSEPNGKYELRLNHVPPGAFQVAVVQFDTCGQRDGDATARDCKKLSNVVGMVTTESCTGDGASQVTEIEFSGP